MPAVSSRSATVAPRPDRTATGEAARHTGSPTAAQIRLWARLIRRGTAWLVACLSIYIAVEVVAFEQAYPQAEDRARLRAIADNPAVRMLQGVPRAVDTTGGYVVWDAGWFLLAALGIWATVVTARLTRGEEDSDRISLVLSTATRARTTLQAQLAVLTGACALTGAGVAGALTATGAGVSGAVLFGAAVTGFGMTAVTATALLAQILPTRRRVLAATGGWLACGYLLRMVANSSDGREALTWVSPFGWVDQVRAYADNRVWALAPLLVAPVLLGGAAVRLRGRRDLGSALLPERGTPRRSAHGLSGPTAFAWRSGRGVLAAWLVGLTGYALVLASVAPAVTRLAEDDPDYRKMLDAMGMGEAFTDLGFVAAMGPMLGLVVALYCCWRMGAMRHEEAAGFADVILAAPVSRWTWLRAHLVPLLAGALVLTAGTAVGLWTGGAIAGADLGPTDAVIVAVGPLPIVVCFTGLAVLAFAAVPRMTPVLPVAWTATAYLFSLLGPVLNVPSALVSVSPFAHPAYVPVEPFPVVASAWLCATGLATAGLGARLLERRDLQPA